MALPLNKRVKNHHNHHNHHNQSQHHFFVFGEPCASSKLSKCFWTLPSHITTFRLPADLLKSIRTNSERKKRKKPPPYRKLTTNRYSDSIRKPAPLSERNIEQCTCDSDTQCDERCVLRAMRYECSRFCPHGERCQNQRLRKRQYAPIQVVETENRGWGVIAAAEIKADALIIEYCGELIDESTCHIRLQANRAVGRKDFYMLRLSSDRIIDATDQGNLARFINHSCSPNCRTEKWTVDGTLRVAIYAERRICEGEELTYDYRADTYFNENDQQPCLCGSINCSLFMGLRPKKIPKRVR